MTQRFGLELRGRTLSEGEGTGQVIVLTAPLSLWGGVDPVTGDIVDGHHPEFGVGLAGSIVCLPGTRGSSTGGPIVLESVRRRTSPVAWLLTESSQILVVGALVAREVYGVHLPVVLLDRDKFAEIRNGDQANVVASTGGATVRIRR